MLWTFVILLVGIIVKFLTSPPSALVKWFLSKFALHPSLNPKEVTVTFNGKHLEEEEKFSFIDYFNEAAFLKEYDIFPGNEKLFLHPETDVIPFVISTKRGKKEVQFFVYRYDDYVDIVKQHKEKVVAYSLKSDNLQRFTVPTKDVSINEIQEKASYII
ncbi:MAG TPA: YfmQ family protein [Chondromyces sp.]|nr:YfmQ family protein [Chondromyces sp.]